MCQLKVKCPIPARIKECGSCDHYEFPFIVSTSEGEVIRKLPKCRAGMSLKTQKAPCPAYRDRMPSIYLDVKNITADELLKFTPAPINDAVDEVGKDISRVIDDTGREYFKAIGVEFVPEEITRRLVIEIHKSDSGKEIYWCCDVIRHVLVMIWEFNNVISEQGRIDGVFRFASLKDFWNVEEKGAEK